MRSRDPCSLPSRTSGGVRPCHRGQATAIENRRPLEPLILPASVDSPEFLGLVVRRRIQGFAAVQVRDDLFDATVDAALVGVDPGGQRHGRPEADIDVRHLRVELVQRPSRARIALAQRADPDGLDATSRWKKSRNSASRSTGTSMSWTTSSRAGLRRRRAVRAENFVRRSHLMIFQ